MSKLIIFPQFSPLPQCTDTANVVENIRNWIERGKEETLTLYCRPDNSEIGYRFARDEDFLETIEQEQTILRRKLKIIFTRHAHTTSPSWYPLHFTTRKITAEIHYNGAVHQYKNDNQLRLFLKANTI